MSEHHEIDLGGFSRAAVELITYIVKKFEGNPRFGMLKLAKVLYFVDRIYLLRHGRTYTGLQYFAFPRGPFTRALYDLPKHHGHLRIHGFLSFDKRIVSSRDFIAAEVDPEVVEIANSTIERYWTATSNELTSLFHTEPWEVAHRKGEHEGYRNPQPILDCQMRLVDQSEYSASLVEKIKALALQSSSGVQAQSEETT